MWSVAVTTYNLGFFGLWSTPLSATREVTIGFLLVGYVWKEVFTVRGFPNRTKYW